MTDEHESRTWHLRLTLGAMAWALALAPAAVYAYVGFEVAVMVGFFLVIGLAYGIFAKLIKYEVNGRV